MQAFAFGVKLPENTLLHAQELRAQVLKCRTYGHAWDEDGKNGEEFGEDNYGRPFLRIRCIRCTSGKRIILGKALERDGRFDYAPGYGREKGSGPLTAADNKAFWLVHLENLRKAAAKKNGRKR